MLMARKINSRQTRQPQKRVIGAGLTEFWYLKHLKPLLDLKFELYPRLFGNESMGEINKLIEEGLNDDAEVICFFDEDVMRWDQVEGKRIKELHCKYDNNSRVTLACSMPSIEYWFLPLVTQSVPCADTLSSSTKRKIFSSIKSGLPN